MPANSSIAIWAALRIDWPTGLGAPFCDSGRIMPTLHRPRAERLADRRPGRPGRRRPRRDVGAGHVDRRIAARKGQGKPAADEGPPGRGLHRRKHRPKRHPPRPARAVTRRITQIAAARAASPPTIPALPRPEDTRSWRRRTLGPAQRRRLLVTRDVAAEPLEPTLGLALGRRCPRNCGIFTSRLAMRRSDAHECRRPETSGGTRGGHDDSPPLKSGGPRERSFLVHGATVPAPPLAPGLYVVATPIGNLGRRDAEGALDLGRRRLNSRRGHPRFAHASLPLRDRDAAFPVPRAQRRRSPAARVAAHGRGSGAGADLRRRHAADFRSRLQAGGGSRRCGPCGDRRPRRLRGARGALRRGSPDRPVLLRRLFAAAERGAAGADRRACRHPRDARLLRGARAGSPRRSPIWRSNSGPGPRRWRAN